MRWSHIHFICIPAVHIISSGEQQQQQQQLQKQPKNNNNMNRKTKCSFSGLDPEGQYTVTKLNAINATAIETQVQMCQPACIIFPTVHGGWTSWSVSTPCSVTCGSGVEVLTRTCTNPAPQHGGTPCQGSSRKDRACTKNPCPS